MRCTATLLENSSNYLALHSQDRAQSQQAALYSLLTAVGQINH